MLLAEPFHNLKRRIICQQFVALNLPDSLWKFCSGSALTILIWFYTIDLSFWISKISSTLFKLNWNFGMIFNVNFWKLTAICSDIAYYLKLVQKRFILSQMVQNWCKLYQNESSVFKLVSFYLKLIKSVEPFLKWCKLLKNGWNLCKLVETSPKWLKHVI